MPLVDYQRLHVIVRLLFVFSHAERELVEGSLDEEFASTAPNQRPPPQMFNALLTAPTISIDLGRTPLCPPSAPGSR